MYTRINSGLDGLNHAQICKCDGANLPYFYSYLVFVYYTPKGIIAPTNIGPFSKCSFQYTESKLKIYI